MLKSKASLIKEALYEYNSDVKCALVFENTYQLLVAVILSAQTTDKAVNKVTPNLFLKYPTILALSGASVQDVYEIIKPLGLALTKSHNLIQMAKQVNEDFLGEIPRTIDELTHLKGVGRKTANVILSEGFNLPGFAVDTHVERTTKRMGLVPVNATTNRVELLLKDLFLEEDWHFMHLALINLGRTICISQKPLCEKCPLKDLCEKKF